MIGILNANALNRDEVSVYIYDPEKDNKSIKKYIFSGCIRKK